MHFRDFLNWLGIPENNWFRRFTVTYIRFVLRYLSVYTFCVSLFICVYVLCYVFYLCGCFVFRYLRYVITLFVFVCYLCNKSKYISIFFRLHLDNSQTFSTKFNNTFNKFQLNIFPNGFNNESIWELSISFHNRTYELNILQNISTKSKF